MLPVIPNVPPRNPERPALSSSTTRPVTLNGPPCNPERPPCNPERPTLSSRTSRHVTLNGPPCHSARPATSSRTSRPVIPNVPPCNPERPTLSSLTSRQVILNLIQDLFFASLDSGSSPDDGEKRAQIPGQARMTGINKPRLLVKPG